ncbi:MAG: NADH-quinone oxidoreductase subunit L [Eggerthellaceae bacterium]|nr:NADH-quinone oxidoreductase subunit L [Eggerthellaceae bacterium]
MGTIGFLIAFPLLVAVLLLVLRADAARNVVVYGGAAIIAAATLFLCCTNVGTPAIYYDFSSAAVDMVCTVASIAIGVCIIAYAVRYKNVWAGILAVVQLVASLVFEFLFAHGVEVQQGIYMDSLSLIMAFIIGIIGTGICVYAIGYMQDFQAEHADEKDRRPTFFAIMFLFLSAMFAIVFCNNMVWMFTAWEVTTLCSFLLIGYTKTDEAIRNAFRQIIMNIAGGIGFVAALFFCAISLETLAFNQFLEIGTVLPALVVFPVMCLSFAGMTKAAQMPFHTWLLGAMVAPTPTSALLHSSTMVKAGVFLLVKLAPVFAVSFIPSLITVLVGAITFCLCSFMAISQSNAKRVLAYSTIANLGLIVACAGVGTPEAIWAAIFLILFHAIAKSLLFLCVGTAEHHIGSRDIESMDLLFERMPRLARLMMLGIMTMFIAPFGMLVSKWATLVSFVDTQQIALIVLLAFGSAATFMFWAKWLGKLSGIAGDPENVETTVHPSEWIATYIMAGLIALCCICLPLISTSMVMPYIFGIYGTVETALSDDILWITSILTAAVMLVLFAGLKRQSSKSRQVDVYMAGISVDNANRTFRNALSGETKATASNWYMTEVFGEARIRPLGEVVCSILIVVGFALSIAIMMALM